MACLVFASTEETARMHRNNVDTRQYGEAEIVTDRNAALKRLSCADAPEWASVNGAMMRAREALRYISDRC